MSNKGKTKVFINGEWKEKKYEDLQVGDVFRMYKNNGHKCVNKKGKFVWLSIGPCVTTKHVGYTEHRVPSFVKKVGSNE